MARTRSLLFVVVVVLILAAALRILELSRLPPGFSVDEIANIQVSETARRLGTIASFYNVGNSTNGHEGLYPVLQALVTSVIGDGLFCYRVLAFWCGLLSVALMYALVRRLFGRFAGLAASIALCVTFWPVLLSRSAVRETLLLPLFLATLLALAWVVHLRRETRPEAPSTLAYTLLALLIAALAYTHWTGLVVMPLVVVYFAFLVLTRQPISRRIVSFAMFGLVVAAILAIPYITFTLRSPSLSGLHVYWATRPQNIGVLLTNAFKTLASIFFTGDSAPQHNLPGSALIGPLAALFFVIGLVGALRAWRKPNMMLVVLALVFGLLPAIWSGTEPNFANMVIALPGIMALIGLGASIAAARLWKTASPISDPRALGAALLIAAVSAAITAWMFFGVWNGSSAVSDAYRGQLGRLAVYLDHTSDNLTTTMCTYNLMSTKTVMSDSALLDLMSHNQDEHLRFSDCLSGLVLTSGGGPQRIAFADPSAADTMSAPSSPWMPDAHAVIPDGLPVTAAVQISVEKELADALGKLTLSHVEWAPGVPGTSPDVTATLPVRMGGYLTFQGYSPDSTKAYKPSDTVTLVTYWRTDGVPIPYLCIFIDILRNS